MFRIFCKFFFFRFNIFCFTNVRYPYKRNLLIAPEKPVLGYDIMILSDLLHFSTSHDALISSIQMLLAKSESARIYVGVSSKSLADFYAN